MGYAMWHELWIAMALVLVIEGILPFLNPRGYKAMMASVSGMKDRSIRLTGLVSMLIGVALLYLVN
jgi:uncharacterized protein YjeT (DUF2065 family)